MNGIERLTKATIPVFLAVVATSFLPAMAAAQTFVYSVKFLCGSMGGPDEGTPERESAVKPGNYATAVNVHNFTGSAVGLTKKAVLANPQGQVRGKISERKGEKVGPDEALEIDCPDIVKLFAGAASELKFIKGFVVIESKVELDVVAVYSASIVRGRWFGLGAGMGLDVEYVSPKRKQ